MDLGSPTPHARATKKKAKENLTLLTEATSGLKTLDSFIGEKDYKALRLALRSPPIGNLRSSARKVIISIDDKDAEEKVGKGDKCKRERKTERERGGTGQRGAQEGGALWLPTSVGMPCFDGKRGRRLLSKARPGDAHIAAAS